MSDSEITIEREGEKPPVNIDDLPPAKVADPVSEPKPAKSAPSRPSVEEEIRNYKQQMLAEGQRRAEVERQRQEEQNLRIQAQQEALQLRTQAVSGQYQMFKSESQRREAELSNLEQSLETALASGDYKTVASLQVKIGKVAADKTQFDMAVAQMEEQARQQPQQPVPPQPQRQLSHDERFVEGIRDPRARDWLRSHPDCLPSGALHLTLMDAHRSAEAKGLQGDDYWRHIETSTGYREGGEVVTPPTRQTRTPSAPVSRNAPGLSGQRRESGPRTLTQREWEIAQYPPFNGDVKAYYEQKQGAIEDGNWAKPFNFPE